MVKYIILVVALILVFEILNYIRSRSFSNSKSKNLMSETEKQIAKCLDLKGIKYKTQFIYKGCKDIRPLPFDFAVMDSKHKVLFLIEYDGEHHFAPVKYKGKSQRQAEKEHAICVKHDRIKDKFCKKNHIDLLRISCYERKQLYKILYRKLNKYGLLN